MQVTAALVKELRERTGAGMMECKRALLASDGDIEAAIEVLRKSGLAKADKKSSRIAAEGIIAMEFSSDGKQAAMVEVNSETDFVAKEREFLIFATAVTRRVLESKPKDLSALEDMPLAESSTPTVDEARQSLVARLGENIAVRRFVHYQVQQGLLGSYLHGTRIGVLLELEGGDETLAKDLAMHIAASRPLCITPEQVPEQQRAKEREIFAAQAAKSGKPPAIIEKMVNGRMKKFLDEVTLMGQPFVKDPDLSVKQLLGRHGAQVLRFTRFEVGEGIERKAENFAEEVMAQVRGA